MKIDLREIETLWINLDSAKKNAKEMNVLIFDFGGGTLDVSLLTLVKDVFEVRATAGNTHLGGIDLDNILVDYFINDFKKKHKIELTDPKALRKLRNALLSIP